MLVRLIAIFLFWGMHLGLAWFIVHEYLAVVSEKLNTISHALGTI
jgi:hypothetical protein